jgi:hypothetical protein
MPNQDEQEARIETRLRAILTVWFGLFLSVGLYYMVTVFTGSAHEFRRPSRRLFLAFAAAGSLLALISIPVKQMYLRRSVREQQVELVQTGYIIAWALSEAAALLGLLNFFITGNRRYYLLFIIAACGLLLNFPRRQHLLDATPKNSRF